MARPHVCQSPCQNLLPVKRVIDEPAEQASEALIDNSGSRASAPIAACAYCLRRSPLQ